LLYFVPDIGGQIQRPQGGAANRNQEHRQLRMDKVYVTQEGLEKLKAELAECNARRLKVAEAIELARSYGDLSENADYHAAKEEQAMLHARIRDLEDKLTRAVVIEDKDIDATKAYLGSTVRALNKKTNKEVVYLLVSPLEMDLAHGRLSVQSPVGKALLGLSVGDTAVAKVPAGEIVLEILEITR